MTGTLTPEGAVKQAMLGWDGGAWHKLPMVWGYSGIAEESLADTNLPGGTNNINGTAVPAGEIWVITHANVRYIGTNPTLLRIKVVGLATLIDIAEDKSPVSDKYLFWDGKIYLQEGDYVRFTAYGATATDDLYGHYAGYKMKIAE